MRRQALLLTTVLFIVASNNLFAQKKEFTYQQLFQGGRTEVTKQLPPIPKWIDDEHYIELRKDESDGKMKSMSVDVKTGKAIPYTNTAVAEPPVDLSLPREAKNITFSPDKNYAAYTLNNNLFITEVASKKTTQITTDGNDSILNGYASWVYYEEILGRASRYRAFGGRPTASISLSCVSMIHLFPCFPFMLQMDSMATLKRNAIQKRVITILT